MRSTARALGLLSALVAISLVNCGSSDDDKPVTHFDENDIRRSWSDGTGAYRYVDTHDAYGNTGVVDKTKFLYFHKVNGKQAVGLTMDCAWVEPANANEVLDVLQRHHDRITFFISGPFIFKTPAKGLTGGLVSVNLPVIKRMIEAGHEFGSHTQTHPHNNASIDWVKENEELKRGWEAVIAQLYPAGPPANATLLDYWRAPSGEYDTRSLGLAAKAGFPYHFGWNVDVRDSTGWPDCRTTPSAANCLNPSKLVDYVIQFGDKNHWSLDGFVILSHLANPYHWGADPNGLDRLLSTVEQKGHVIARISEMFDDVAGSH